MCPGHLRPGEHGQGPNPAPGPAGLSASQGRIYSIIPPNAALRQREPFPPAPSPQPRPPSPEGRRLFLPAGSAEAVREEKEETAEEKKEEKEQEEAEPGAARRERPLREGGAEPPLREPRLWRLRSGGCRARRGLLGDLPSPAGDGAGGHLGAPFSLGAGSWGLFFCQ